MDDKRRGFISTAAGLGVFAVGTSAAAQASGPIPRDAVLVAMPGDRYYAIPRQALEQFSVAADAFAAEEKLRLEADAVRTRGRSSSAPPPPPPPRTVAMGVRG
jgi:hypothetical protein